MCEQNIKQKIVLGEIEGKNLAVHAYDKMIWTVRTGFLTLFFAGWGILLKSILSSPSKECPNFHNILITMILVSTTLGFGAFIVDRNYVRRKFRVINALDKLLAAIMTMEESSITSFREIKDYIEVSGDKDNQNYKKVSGYSSAFNAAVVIYCVPINISIICVFLLW